MLLEAVNFHQEAGLLWERVCRAKQKTKKIPSYSVKICNVALFADMQISVLVVGFSDKITPFSHEFS